jgi:hypothetical protein
MSDETTPEIEYARMWMQQSQLFWSRLQTAAILHSGVLAAWYKLPEDSVLKTGVLCLGIFLSVFIIAIMVRDSQYMKEMRRRAGKSFPDTGKDAPHGRTCGYIIVSVFPIIELLILLLRKP